MDHHAIGMGAPSGLRRSRMSGYPKVRGAWHAVGSVRAPDPGPERPATESHERELRHVGVEEREGRVAGHRDGTCSDDEALGPTGVRGERDGDREWKRAEGVALE